MDPHIISKITRVQPESKTHHTKAGESTTGPYWYGYWQENGNTMRVYIGRQLPPELQAIYDSRYLRPGHIKYSWPGTLPQA